MSSRIRVTRKQEKPNQRITLFYDKITRPRYNDAERNAKDIIPLKPKTIWSEKEKEKKILTFTF